MSSTDPELIRSAANPLIRRLRALAQRRERTVQQAAIVEGVQPVRQAVEAGVDIDTLVTAPDLLVSESTREFVATQEAAGTRIARLTGELFGRISERDGPSGLAAIVRIPTFGPGALDLTGPLALLAVERLANPGNLGTILRTADATGTRAVILVGPTADPWDRAAIKASMGAVFHVPTVRFADLASVTAWARGAGLGVVTTAGRAEHELWSAPLPARALVVLGSERDGLDDTALADGDLAVRIPMTGHAESLNVAVAGGVLLYELYRRRTVPAPA